MFMKRKKKHGLNENKIKLCLYLENHQNFLSIKLKLRISFKKTHGFSHSFISYLLHLHVVNHI